MCLLFRLSELSCSKPQCNFCVLQFEDRFDYSDFKSTGKRVVILFVISFYSDMYVEMIITLSPSDSLTEQSNSASIKIISSNQFVI